jgi:hypothetical protein
LLLVNVAVAGTTQRSGGKPLPKDRHQVKKPTPKRLAPFFNTFPTLNKGHFFVTLLSYPYLQGEEKIKDAAI